MPQLGTNMKRRKGKTYGDIIIEEGYSDKC